MLENILFYIVFTSQIFLLSYYYPKNIIRRIADILEKYPRVDYPKLYPKSVEETEKGQRIFNVLSKIILIIGLIILAIIVSWNYSYEGRMSEIIPVIYFMVQIIPFILLEISGFSYLRMMRKADSSTTRNAELAPRKLTNFISPVYIGIAVLMSLLCIAYFYSLYEFQFSFNNDTFIILLSLIMSNGLFIGIIYWNLYGKKLDPHQTAQYRMRQIGVTVKSLVFMSIAASIFLIAIKAVDQYNSNFLGAIIMSFYLQFVVFIGLGATLRTLKLENMNFDVYKEDLTVPKN